MRYLIFLLAGMLVLSSSALARTWYVKPDSTGDVPTITVALDSAAACGDTVLLASGTFAGEGNREIDCLDKVVTIVSESGNPDLCIVDCGCGSGCFERRVGFYFRESANGTPRLEGITITGACGGVICDTSACPEILSCIFRDNTCLVAEVGYPGAGIYCCDGSEPTIIDCVFLGNSADGGGGMACLNSSPTLINVSFIENGGSTGGGMLSYGGAPSLSGCVFEANFAAAPIGRQSGGGGLFCSGSPSLVECTFKANLSHTAPGGGLCFAPDSDLDHLSLDGCVFISNCVEGVCGGAIAGWGDLWGHQVNMSLVNCTLWNNGACYTACEGGGLCVVGNSDLSLENTLIAFSSDGEGIRCYGSGTPSLSCCDVYGNADGDYVGCIEGLLGTSGNISANPLFCNAPAGDLTLESCSPCLPGYHPDGYDCGGIIGAYGSGCDCGAPVEPATWGGVKAMYR